jgi:hypothetical protein
VEERQVDLGVLQIGVVRQLRHHFVGRLRRRITSCDREVSLETPAYFVALDLDGDRVVSIHDFLFARYAMDGVDLSPLSPAPLVSVKMNRRTKLDEI